MRTVWAAWLLVVGGCSEAWSETDQFPCDDTINYDGRIACAWDDVLDVDEATPGFQLDCKMVRDTTGDSLLACTPANVLPCWRYRVDETACPGTREHIVFEVIRADGSVVPAWRVT